MLGLGIGMHRDVYIHTHTSGFDLGDALGLKASWRFMGRASLLTIFMTSQKTLQPVA